MRKEVILKNGVECIVRKVCVDDASNMIGFVNKINHETENLTMEPDEFNLTIDEEKAIINEFDGAVNGLWLIAEVGGKIVASTSVKGGRRKRTKHLASMGISVLKECWHIGVGSALMECIIDWAKTVEISKINLEVRVDNKNAIKLYKKYGFVNSGINTRGLKIRDKYVDLYMMGLEINRGDKMIRLLNENDRQKVLDYVTKEPAFNLFIIGDIENYGFDNDFQQLWGDFDNDQLQAIMLRYHENYILYSDIDNYDFSELLNIYHNDNSKAKMISGKDTIINRINDKINYTKKMEDFFCELKNSSDIPKGLKYQVESARVEDAQEIFELLERIEEFDSLPRSVERIKKKISEGISKLYYIRLNNEIVTVVQTTADNKYSTMVVGVATKKEYRGQGLMSECLSKLCTDVLSEGKTLCLFYDNPKAGRIYHRLGFNTIGKWSMLIEKSE